MFGVPAWWGALWSVLVLLAVPAVAAWFIAPMVCRWLDVPRSVELAVFLALWLLSALVQFAVMAAWSSLTAKTEIHRDED